MTSIALLGNDQVNVIVTKQPPTTRNYQLTTRILLRYDNGRLLLSTIVFVVRNVKFFLSPTVFT